MGKTTFTPMGNRGLSCLEWCLRGASVMLAVLIPALVRPEKDVWVAAGAAGFCVGACQGLLLLAGRARRAKAVRAASEAICAKLEERINHDLAVILASVSGSQSGPGSPQSPLAEMVQRCVTGISGQLRDVTGTGGGMNLEARARRFEPAVSPESDGTGLGSSGAEGFVKQGGGHVALAGPPSLGTAFKTYRPAGIGPVAEPPQSALPKRAQGGETILLVEDEDPVREMTALHLETLGYRVLQAASAEEALRLVGAGREKLDLLLTDVVMPGMGGRELAEALQSRRPGLKVFFQSGYPAEVAVGGGTVQAKRAFLQKPFTLEALSRKVREVLDAPRG
jgi:CheY-like chemotaxis protein